MRKILSVILTICMIVSVVGMLPINVSAATYSGSCGTNVKWSLNTTTGLLAISGTGAMTDYDTYRDTPWYTYADSIKKVEIKSGVTGIGDWAFAFNPSLMSVTIPASVTSIGSKAFSYCYELREVYWNAKNVKEFSSKDWVFECSGSTSGGISVTFGDDVERIPAYCFDSEYSDDKPNVTSVTFGASVKSIGAGAFYSDSDIKTYYTGSLKDWLSISFATAISNPADGGLYINGKLLTEAVIPNGVTSIGNYAFVYNPSLMSVTIPASVTRIGTDAFYACSHLEYVYISDLAAWCGIEFDSSGYSAVSANPLYYANDLYVNNELVTELVIPDSVTEIGFSAFTNYRRLTSVTIPDSVTKIGNYAFYGCVGLKDVYYNNTKEEWAKISIGSNNTYLTNATIHYPSIGSGTCGENLEWVLSAEGVLTIGGTGAMENYTTSNAAPWMEYAGEITKIVVEDGVTTIGDRAFYSLSNVTEIELGNSITTIGEGAFRGASSFASITIPTSVTSIEKQAFLSCASLADVYYNGILDDWNSISIGSFNPSLTKANIHCKNCVSVIIDSTETEYDTFEEALKAAEATGKAVEFKLLADLQNVSVESSYKHTVNLNGNTVYNITVAEDIVLTNGSIATLNVTGFAKTENVTVTSTNAASYGVEGTKGVYTSYGLGTSIVDGAQVRIGDGVVDGKIDSQSGLRFVGTVDLNDTLAGMVINDYYADNAYTEGYGVGIEIGAEDSKNKAYIKAVKWQDDSNGVFSAAVTGLNANNFNRSYSARCYVEYDGVKIFESGKTERSMYQVASGLLINNKATTEELLNVLNAYVNQTGVRLTLTSTAFAARVSGVGAYTGEAFFTVGETRYEDGMYMVELTAIGQAKIDVDLFNSYVRINNNNSLVRDYVYIEDSGDGVYTILFDYASLN